METFARGRDDRVTRRLRFAASESWSRRTRAMVSSSCSSVTRDWRSRCVLWFQRSARGAEKKSCNALPRACSHETSRIDAHADGNGGDVTKEESKNSLRLFGQPKMVALLFLGFSSGLPLYLTKT